MFDYNLEKCSFIPPNYTVQYESSCTSALNSNKPALRFIISSMRISWFLFVHRCFIDLAWAIQNCVIYFASDGPFDSFSDFLEESLDAFEVNGHTEVVCNYFESLSWCKIISPKSNQSINLVEFHAHLVQKGVALGCVRFFAFVTVKNKFNEGCCFITSDLPKHFMQ